MLLKERYTSLPDHLRRWMKKCGLDPKRVDGIVNGSSVLQVMIDLCNNDKHGYPPRDGGRSGRAPKLEDIQRVLRLATGAGPALDLAMVSSGGRRTPFVSVSGPAEVGSTVAVTFTPLGPKVSGSGSAYVVVTAKVVDEHGSHIGDLYELEVEALKVWEREMKCLGILGE